MKVYLFLLSKNYDVKPYVVNRLLFLWSSSKRILFRKIYSCATKLRIMKMYGIGGTDPPILDLVIRHRRVISFIPLPHMVTSSLSQASNRLTP